MRFRTLAVLVVVLGTAALVSACGGSTSASVQPSELPSSTAVPGAPISHTTAVGKSFTVVASLESNSQAHGTFSITVERVTCGPLPTPTATDTLVDGVPTPAAGQEFCTVLLSGTNTTNAPAFWQPNGLMLYAGSASYADAETKYDVFTYSEAFPYLGTVMNPGTSSTDIDVFQLPAGTQPTSVWVPDGSTVGGQDSGVMVQLGS